MGRYDGYILNAVLRYLSKDCLSPVGDAFRSMSGKDRAKFFRDILKIGSLYDCYDAEVMSFLGGKYGFCYECQENKEPPETEDYDEECYRCEDCSQEDEV